jgi:D-beta-D-heptose 7-phosphate kinase / D-beta-D-heptose 1-phosphate adenosyltransferase
MNNIFESVTEMKNTLPKDRRFTLIGGYLDLIHVGHIYLLEYAATLEYLLVVAVLSDSYAQKHKDSRRPIINQNQRVKMVASIRIVDFAYVSHTSPSSLETLELLKPDSVVFDEGGDKERLDQRMKNIAIASPSTKIRFLPRYNKENISTSYIINKIRMTNTS